MRVQELAVVVYFTREIRIVLIRGFQNDLQKLRQINAPIVLCQTYLGIVCKLVSREIDLAKGAFANQSSKSVIADAAEVRRGKLPINRSIGF